MKKEKIIEIINNFLIEDIEIEEHKITGNALLKNDLGIDSLDFVDIVVIVERNFGIKIIPEEMASISTLNEFYDYIESKLTDN
ncbi:MAG: phosphopantetheine-binding protein [Prevotellaceae bacterium]|jgi:acyl carrier protein|nr:phosphopantetheine-binding protein [Prevotellaceae bacterium]